MNEHAVPAGTAGRRARDGPHQRGDGAIRRRRSRVRDVGLAVPRGQVVFSHPAEGAQRRLGPDPREAQHSKVLEIVASAPEGFVVTELDGRILFANRAFLDLVQLATEEQARNESLERWLGRPGVDFNLLTAQLREHGSLRLFATQLRGEYGSSSDVEICAVSVVDGEEPCFGFTIRDVGQRVTFERQVSRDKPRSVAQLTELVGPGAAEGSGARVDGHDREAVHRGGAGDHRRQPCVRGGNTRAQPPEPVRKTAPLRPRRTRLGRERAVRMTGTMHVLLRLQRPDLGLSGAGRCSRAAEADHLVSAHVGVCLRRGLLGRARAAALADRSWPG